MNNYTLNTADRLTHLKIVVVSLVAGIAVVGVGIAARPDLPDMSTRWKARAPVLKAGQPVIWTQLGPGHHPLIRVSDVSPSDSRAPFGRAIFLAGRSKPGSGRHVAGPHQADGVELGLLDGPACSARSRIWSRSSSSSTFLSSSKASASASLASLSWAFSSSAERLRFSRRWIAALA